MIRFFLNATYMEIEDVAPDITVLQFLRTQLKQVDVKEGCASGDCGACTLVVASREDASCEPTYQSLNGCISYLGNMDGKWLITPQGLASSLNMEASTQPSPPLVAGDANSKNLHPVQQAMVDFHGSQCGFCTPGFIMSMFAFYKTRQAIPSAARSALTHEALAVELGGNLCRCTGYSPIYEACFDVLENPMADAFDQWVDHVFDTLNPPQGVAEQTTSLDALHRHFFVPKSLSELHGLRFQYPNATLVAGATDLGLETSVAYRDFDVVISTAQVKKLRRLKRKGRSVRVGAAVTYSQLEPLFDEKLPAFARLLRHIGSRQIRNLGTLGGNVMSGSPIGDTLPMLLCLDATLVLEKAKKKSSTRRNMPLADFYLGYKQKAIEPLETLVAIEFDLPTKEAFIETYKVSKRFDDDISAVCLAIMVKFDGLVVESVRVAFGGMAATPVRVTAVEDSLQGKPWTMNTIESAQAVLGQALTPMSDMRASADYRMQVAKNLLMRAYLESITEAVQTESEEVSSSGRAPVVQYASIESLPRPDDLQSRLFASASDKEDSANA